MALSPYYTGDEVPLKFKCYDGGTPENPTKAEVRVVRQNPYAVVLEGEKVEINSNEVSFTVPKTATTIDSDYVAFFRLTMSKGHERTHAIDFTVISCPG